MLGRECGEPVSNTHEATGGPSQKTAELAGDGGGAGEERWITLRVEDLSHARGVTKAEFRDS